MLAIVYKLRNKKAIRGRLFHTEIPPVSFDTICLDRELCD
jgi:hypothetical protein